VWRREQPVRFRSRLFALLGSLIALFMVQVLLFYSQLAFLDQGRQRPSLATTRTTTWRMVRLR
jgi:hypothetical protein